MLVFPVPLLLILVQWSVSEPSSIREEPCEVVAAEDRRDGIEGRHDSRREAACLLPCMHILDSHIGEAEHVSIESKELRTRGAPKSKLHLVEKIDGECLRINREMVTVACPKKVVHRVDWLVRFAVKDVQRPVRLLAVGAAVPYDGASCASLRFSVFLPAGVALVGNH